MISRGDRRWMNSTCNTYPLSFTYKKDASENRPSTLVLQRNLQREATEDEEQRIYARKSELFQHYNSGATLPGAKEVLNLVRDKGLKPVLVTGSGQPSLLNRLDIHFPGIFTPQTMVTAFDVVNGKPDPEPFLMGLEKGGNLRPNQAIVIENAPLGIQAAVAAGIFTIAVNTGPLSDTILKRGRCFAGVRFHDNTARGNARNTPAG